MPLQISPELQAHLGQTSTTLATCLEITLADGSGVVYRFTDHDKSIEYPVSSGFIYNPTSGYVSSASNTKIDLSVDNLDIIGIIDDNLIKFDDLLAGRFDFAKAKIFQVNYEDLTMGDLSIISGKIGNVSLKDNSFTAELRSLTQHFQQTTGTSYSVLCRADFGDSECTFDISSVTVSLLVTDVDPAAPNRIFTTDLIEIDDFYNFGLVTWNSGSSNEFFKMDVKKFLNNTNQGIVELYEPMPSNIVIGDTATIYPGCDKTWDTCKNRYTNQLFYRGYPHLYGLSTALRGKT